MFESRDSTPEFPEPWGPGTPDIFQPVTPGFEATKPRSFGVDNVPLVSWKKNRFCTCIIYLISKNFTVFLAVTSFHVTGNQRSQKWEF